MTKIAILGATGYTALELMKLLLRHPGVEISALTSRRENRPVDQVHPSLTGQLGLPLENLEPTEVARRAEAVFSCLPHTATAAVVPELLAGGAKVIDFGADYRFNDVAVYEKWYNVVHPDAARLSSVPYGLPELFRSAIKGAPLVANPGCYATSALLPLTPLVRAGLVLADDIIIDAKSGVSGAGRNPSLKNLYPECNEGISAYGVGTHRHTPEIEQVVSDGSGKKVRVIFTPHLIPMDRGILAVCYAKSAHAGLTQEDVLDEWRAFYRDEPFIQVVEALPSTKDVIYTNRCHMTARVVGDRVLTISVIDNLIKGASGAAVQNFNILFGYPETTALK